MYIYILQHLVEFFIDSFVQKFFIYAHSIANFLYAIPRISFNLIKVLSFILNVTNTNFQ